MWTYSFGRYSFFSHQFSCGFFDWLERMAANDIRWKEKEKDWDKSQSLDDFLFAFICLDIRIFGGKQQQKQPSSIKTSARVRFYSKHFDKYIIRATINMQYKRDFNIHTPTLATGRERESRWACRKGSILRFTMNRKRRTNQDFPRNRIINLSLLKAISFGFVFTHCFCVGFYRPVFVC